MNPLAAVLHRVWNGDPHLPVPRQPAVRRVQVSSGGGELNYRYRTLMRVPRQKLQFLQASQDLEQGGNYGFTVSFPLSRAEGRQFPFLRGMQ